MKRKLRFFCDYMADSPLWESWEWPGSSDGRWPEQEYNKSKNTLLSFGVQKGTIVLMGALQFIFEWPPHDKGLSDTEANAYAHLSALILERLENEIGDRFEIEVID